MATRWADGFEDYASGSTNFATDYTVTAGTGVNVTTGRRSGSQAMSTTNGALNRTIGGTESTIFASVAVNPAGLINGNIIQFFEGATVHVEIRTTNTGAIEARRNGTLLGTSAAYFTTNNWGWIQVKVVIHDTAGSVEVRDGSGNVLLNLTSQDTRNGGTGYCDTVKLLSPGSSVHLFDDWHIWDSTGSVCNTWTNDTRVDSKLPDGAGNSTQFTASTGSNYDCVNDATWNSTDYVDDSTAGHKDTYTFGDISHNPPNIYAVLVTAVAQKDDAGARSLKMVVRRSSTDYSGSSVSLTQGSYVRVVDIRETDPSTSAAWTATNFNAAEFGFENV